MINFSSVKIKYIGTVVTGKTPSTKKASNFGNEYMFVTPSDLLNGYIIKSTERYLSSSGLQSISSNTIDGISVLVGCIGSDMGNVAITTEKCATNQQINAITNFKPGINPFYVYYWLLPKKKYLRQIAGCTTTPILPKTTFEEIEITIPEIHHQNKIVDILSSIDNKIELNNRIIAELEAMAKTIYDYWFVQFDFPNAEGKPYRSSGGEMVWNEQLKREIPKGWSVNPLPKHCQIIDCLHSEKPSLVFENEDYYLLQLDNLIDNGLISLANKYYVSKEMYELWTSRIEVVEGDLVITNAGRVGAIARIPKHVKAGIGRNMTAIRPNDVPACFLYYFFTSSDIARQIKMNTDLGSFFGSLNVRGIKELKIILPPKNMYAILNKFEDYVSPLRSKIELLAQENLELTKLRDWLLPMLMNGQVNVK